MTPPEDVIREAIGSDLGEYEIQAPLAALDQLLTELEQVKAERDAARERVEECQEYHLPRSATAKLQAQLRTAREALERIFHSTNNESGEADIARQALTHLEGEGL